MADGVDEKKELKVIQMVKRINRPVCELEAVVSVKVLGEVSVDADKLADYLAKSAKLTIDSARDEHSVVHCQIDWATLRRSM